MTENITVRLTGYLVIVAVVTVLAFGVGRAVGPLDDEPAPPQHGEPTPH